MFDVIIIGAGPAGLSAALVLGRCRRSVLVLDDGRPRNAGVAQSWGFLTRDGTSPDELRRIGREQLLPYGVQVLERSALGACVQNGVFEVTLDDGSLQRCRKLILATGLSDELPPFEGVEALYPRSVHHCPYCHGWEVRDQSLAAYGQGSAGVELALSLLTWSRDVMLFTHGAALPKRAAESLQHEGVRWHRERVVRLEGEGGQLSRIVLSTGVSIPRQALFFHTATRQRSPLAVQLGCELNRHGTVRTGKLEESNVPGLYVVGDASRDVQFIVVAAAEGAKAAVAVNKALRAEDIPSPSMPQR